MWGLNAGHQDWQQVPPCGSDILDLILWTNFDLKAFFYGLWSLLHPSYSIIMTLKQESVGEGATHAGKCDGSRVRDNKRAFFPAVSTAQRLWEGSTWNISNLFHPRTGTDFSSFLIKENESPKWMSDLFEHSLSWLVSGRGTAPINHVRASLPFRVARRRELLFCCS